MSGQRKMLRQMGRSCCFPTAALEIHDRNYLQQFTRATMRDVPLVIRTPVPIEIETQFEHLLCSIAPAAGL